MSPSKRMRAWGAAISSGHVSLGLAGWLLMGIQPWFFGGCALLTLAIFLFAAPLMRPRRGGDDGDDDRGSDGPGPDDPEPPWWPGFEREFRDYANGHLTAR